MYDGQLKKMLAYVAAAITSFVAQLTVFYFVVGGNAVPHSVPAYVVATLLWLSQCYFSIAVVTKYHELKILEHELGITDIRGRIYYSNRPRFSKLWDKFHREHSGINARDYRKLARRLDYGTAIVLSLVTLMYIYIVWTIFNLA
jgi:hypothetical protein